MVAESSDHAARGVRLGSHPSLRARRDVWLPRTDASLEHLCITWFPADKQVLVQNLSAARTVVVYRWGCAPWILSPDNSLECDARFAIRIGEFSDYWAYVSPDCDDWDFEFAPAAYLRNHPEFSAPITDGRITPPTWVEPYRALRPVITDEHRRSVAVHHHRQLRWPPNCLPDRVARYTNGQVSRKFAHKGETNVSRDVGKVEEVISGLYHGNREGIMDFLARNKLITYANIHPMLSVWDLQETNP